MSDLSSSVVMSPRKHGISAHVGHVVASSVFSSTISHESGLYLSSQVLQAKAERDDPLFLMYSRFWLGRMIPATQYPIEYRKKSDQPLLLHIN